MFARLGTCCVLLSILAAPAFAKDDEEKIQDDKIKDEKTPSSVPEIAPIAAGALGLFVVGGLALLTTRRRPASAPSDARD